MFRIYAWNFSETAEPVVGGLLALAILSVLILL
jgi:hypothetical protein